MNNEDIKERLEEQQQALVKIYRSVEKTRKMIFWSGVATALTFLVPLIIIVIMLPKIMGTLTSSIDLLGEASSASQLDSVDAKSLSDALNNLKKLGF